MPLKTKSGRFKIVSITKIRFCFTVLWGHHEYNQTIDTQPFCQQYAKNLLKTACRLWWRDGPIREKRGMLGDAEEQTMLESPVSAQSLAFLCLFPVVSGCIGLFCSPTKLSHTFSRIQFLLNKDAHTPHGRKRERAVNPHNVKNDTCAHTRTHPKVAARG